MMKYYVRATACLVTLFLSIPAIAQSPVQITQQLILEIQKKQSLEPVADQIDWDSAFEQLDPALKKQMAINSADDLKKNQLQAYSGMGNQVGDGVAKALANAKPEQAAILKIMDERLKKSLAAQNEKTRQDFSETKYSIGKTETKDTKAQVEVIKKRNGTMTTAKLEFVNVNGNWKLKSAAPLSPTFSGERGEQSTALLGPTIASPNEAVLRIH